MADQSPYPYPSPTTQLEQLAGAAQAQQASSPSAQDYTPSQQQRPPNPRKRRADGSSASARGVANLTPDQLAKKRANDREAQRAIRERTRNTIETLERRIKELEGQQPFQELQGVVRARDAALAENEELKKRLQSIAALTQFQSGGHGLNDLALATAQQAPLPLPGQQSQTPQQQQSSYHQAFTHEDDGNPASMSQQHIHPDLRSLQAHHMGNGSTGSRSHTPGKSELQDWQRMPAHYSQGQDLGSQAAQDLDSALQNLVALRRSTIDSNSASEESTLSVSGLVSSFPDQDSSSSLSAELAAVVNAHLSTADLPKRAAMLYITNLMVQWLASPSQDTFARLPEWLRPTQLQLDRAHPAFLDLLPWPQTRDRALATTTSAALATFASVGINWPYDPSLCLSKVSGQMDDEEEDWILSPVFEAHARMLDNWTLSSAASQQDGRDEGLEGLLQGLGASEGQT
ncbi:hypothetical protein ANO11243_039110 [Dothideomycetidae sp. 11243]|nr:hypothetical protein ANO11243_039110 [fungal sp. No.11243]